MDSANIGDSVVLGLKRGTVELSSHQESWHERAAATISMLKALLGHTAIDIQHIGSTAIRGIHAKPILDIAVGVKSLGDVKPLMDLLDQNGIVFRGQDVAEQLLFVMGDFERDTRTHHIHFVEWNSIPWNHYMNFRDYLNTFPDKAEMYDALKQRLAAQYAEDRGSYTSGKQELIDQLLREAQLWRAGCLHKEQYLKNPCRASSIPYWKAVCISLPDNMKILHDDEFKKEILEQYTDEPYFRLKHDLQGLKPAVIPEGFTLCAASPGEYADHINQCYDGSDVTAIELQRYIERAVYCPELWLAVRDNNTGKIVATGIAELDREVEEGILEWIQVSNDYRSRGLGSYIVCELLWRMRDAARFVTVSGQCNNRSNPEILYRKCGFTGNDVWHILRRRESPSS